MLSTVRQERGSNSPLCYLTLLRIDNEDNRRISNFTRNLIPTDLVSFLLSRKLVCVQTNHTGAFEGANTFYDLGWGNATGYFDVTARPDESEHSPLLPADPASAPPRTNSATSVSAMSSYSTRTPPSPSRASRKETTPRKNLRGNGYDRNKNNYHEKMVLEKPATVTAVGNTLRGEIVVDAEVGDVGGANDEGLRRYDGDYSEDVFLGRATRVSIHVETKSYHLK